MNMKRSMRRRDFLTRMPLAAAGAAAFPTIVKASALGLDSAVPPSDRIVMAGIGFGMQGPGNMQNFLGKDEVQWVAGCYAASALGFAAPRSQRSKSRHAAPSFRLLQAID